MTSNRDQTTGRYRKPGAATLNEAIRSRISRSTLGAPADEKAPAKDAEPPRSRALPGGGFESFAGVAEDPNESLRAELRSGRRHRQ